MIEIAKGAVIVIIKSDYRTLTFEEFEIAESPFLVPKAQGD